MVKRRTLRFMVTYPSFSFTYSACMILFLAHSKASCVELWILNQVGKLLQKCLFHAGWMYKRSSELGADGKIDARNKQGRSVVETGRFAEISGRNPEHYGIMKGLINRLFNSIAVITLEPAGQAT